MELKFQNLKNLDKLEALSYQNRRDLYCEELKRFPLEEDEACLFRLKKDLETSGNFHAFEAAEKVAYASEPLEKLLDDMYDERRKLLSEKSYLTGETAIQMAIAKSTIKEIDETDLSLENQRPLKKLKIEEKKIVSRMEYNMSVLEEWDSDIFKVSARRAHLRRMMGCGTKDGERYETELGGRMYWAKQGNINSRRCETRDMLNSGEAEVEKDGCGFRIYSVNVDSIATPLPEKQYLNGNEHLMGYMALMEHMPEITRHIRLGMSVDEIFSDGDLRAKAERLITRKSPVAVSRIGARNFLDSPGYQATDLQSQRRVLIARVFGVSLVPARVENVIKER
ncbi:MAG: hypothetical protein LBS53_01300 [Synergistaceae bacterium]|jgi:hypothetical protein|nr:hypothetical protein [Synergistaceae bacterium]